MKNLKLLLSLSMIVLIIGCQSNNHKKISEKEKSTTPNIILILADDFGFVDTQAYAKHFMNVDTSQMYYETPNIEGS